MAAAALLQLFKDRLGARPGRGVSLAVYLGLVTVVALSLGRIWMPLGPETGDLANTAFVLAPVALLLGAFALLQRCYSRILGFCLRWKLLFLGVPALVVVVGALCWLGAALPLSLAGEGVAGSAFAARAVDAALDARFSRPAM